MGSSLAERVRTVARRLGPAVRLHHLASRVRSLAQRVASATALHWLLAGYASYVLLGWGLLCLPMCRASGGGSALDHLFVATSAVSTTGLSPLSTSGCYTFAGQAVVLILIQLGGLGYMTISSFTVLAVSGDLSPLRRRISEAALNLPTGFDAARFLRVVVVFTLAAEGLGAAALYPSFAARGAPQPVWQAVFHSISAFCTAGFGLYDDSFESFRDDRWLNVVVTVLSLLGAMGFLVVNDLWQSLLRRRPAVTFTSRVILAVTAVLWLGGTVLIAWDERAAWSGPAVDLWLTASFQSMSASTTVGFNTAPIAKLSDASTLVLIVAMIVGASPTGTGGGLKTTTFSAVWAVLVSVIRRRDAIALAGRRIPDVRIRTAVANLVFYLATLATGVYLLTLSESAGLVDLAFEAVSALGTVGLSRGITASLSDAGKWTIVGLMFLGRVGPVAFAMGFLRPAPTSPGEHDDLVV